MEPTFTKGDSTGYATVAVDPQSFHGQPEEKLARAWADREEKILAIVATILNGATYTVFRDKLTERIDEQSGQTVPRELLLATVWWEVPDSVDRHMIEAADERPV